MTPLPASFAGRWDPAREGQRLSYRDAVCWHVLLGGDPAARAAAEDAQARLARVGGFHPVPPRWLHMTLLRAGTARDIPPPARAVMLGKARAALEGAEAPSVTVGRVLYHPEAVALRASPAAVLEPLRAAVAEVTGEVTGAGPDPGGAGWIPHLTVGYSTGEQPAGPVIAALGKTVPPCTVTVRRVSLVVQSGPEDAWDWQVEGSVDLQPPGKIAGGSGTA